MPNELLIQIIGYLAPAALVVSFFFKKVKVLRLVNTAGCLLFIAYGSLIGAWPVVAANAIISLTNLYFLLFSKELKYVREFSASRQQQQFMREAIRMAHQNVSDLRGGPFGAVVVRDGELIATASNHVTADNDPTSHAEINAIRAACQKLKTFDLSGCELYASCEPGPLSLSAIYWARIDKVYYAASRSDAAAVGFDDSPIYDELGRHLNHRKLPMLPLLQNEGAVPLQEWLNAGIKIMY